MLAAESHWKASRVWKDDFFYGEIIPVEVEDPLKEGPYDDPEVKFENETSSKNDAIRHNPTFQSMTKLKPFFTADRFSSTTNSSQIRL